MTLKRAIIIVALAGIIFSGIGGAVGWLLGVYSPEYYRTVFEGGDDPDFDPVQMGLSLGLMQGLGAGVVVAPVIPYGPGCRLHCHSISNFSTGAP